MPFATLETISCSLLLSRHPFASNTTGGRHQPSLKNVPLLTTVRPHLTFAHAANAFAEVATRFVAVTYTDRARPKSLNNNLVAVFLFDFSE
jgi:hypothetical protein